MDVATPMIAGLRAPSLLDRDGSEQADVLGVVGGVRLSCAYLHL